MNLLHRLFAAAAAAVAFAAPAYAAGNAETGRALYRSRCAACHSLDCNGVGPAHRRVFGRAAGEAKGYSESDALKALRQVWSAETLDRWLADPERIAPGQRMAVSVPDVRERADRIAVLQTYAATP